jgi:hypothetical protein
MARRNPTTENQVQTKISPCGICTARSAIGRGLSPSTSVVSCQCHWERVISEYFGCLLSVSLGEGYPRVLRLSPVSAIGRGLSPSTSAVSCQCHWERVISEYFGCLLSVSLGEGYLRVLRLSPVSVIPPMLLTVERRMRCGMVIMNDKCEEKRSLTNLITIY